MKSRILVVASAMLATLGISAFGGDYYNVAKAIDASSKAGKIAESYTDELGGVWRFGRVEPDDVSAIANFDVTTEEHSCYGFKESSAGLPFLVGNATESEHEGVQGTTLYPNYAVLHPGNHENDNSCVAMQLKVAKAAKYVVNMDVIDGNGGGGDTYNDGILFQVYVGENLAESWNVSGEKGIASITKELSLDLAPDTPILFVVNPNVNYSYDTTILKIIVAEDNGQYVDPTDRVFGSYEDVVSTIDLTGMSSCRITESGIYDFAMLVTKLEYKEGATSSDELIRFYRNGVKDLVAYCDPNKTVKRFALGDYYRRGDVISYEINSEVVVGTPRRRAILTEVSRQFSKPLIDVNALYYAAVRTDGGVLPMTSDVGTLKDVVLSAGRVANNITWFQESYQFSNGRYTYAGEGNYTGFAENSNFPWVLINDSDAMGPVNSAFATEPVRKGEIVMHPNTGNDNIFVKVTVPTNRYVKLVMIARDIMSGGTTGAKGVVSVDWNASHELHQWSGGANGAFDVDGGRLSRVIVAGGLNFVRDDAACFAIDAQTLNGCDSTAVKAWVFIDDEFETMGANTVNVDFDGEQPNDGNGKPITYSGMGAVDVAGSYWNGYHHMEKTENAFTITDLKTANGTPSPITVSFASADGSLIGFDNNGAGSDATAAAAFKMDYLYLFGQTVNITFAGLKRNHIYDLYFFGTNGEHSSATFGGTTVSGGNGASFYCEKLACDAMHFAGLRPDDEGKISGSIYGDGAAGVFPGFQIVDVTPPSEETPLVIIIR